MTSLWRVGAGSVDSMPFEPGARHDVVVIGAGLTGLCTAVMLTRAGFDVAVIEASEVGGLTSGANTGKLSLLQGDRLLQIRRHHSAALVRAYVDANRAGFEWLLELADDAGVSYSMQSDYSYAQLAGARETLYELHAASREAGLPTQMRLPAHLDMTGFPLAGAVELADQATIDPMRIVTALARAFVDAGGKIHTGIRAMSVRVSPMPRVDTRFGEMLADHIVLATGTPFTNRGLYFAKTHGTRSYCVAFRVPQHPVDATYISVDAPTRSIRPVTDADGPASTAQLIVGGGSHPVGRVVSERGRYEEIVEWTHRHFAGAEEVQRWSAQDYESHNLIPFVGVMPRSRGRIRFATGFAKWGLSNAPAAAMRIAAEIQGVRFSGRPAWMRTIATRITVPADVGRGLKENAAVALAAARGWTDAAQRPLSPVNPAEGQGVVARDGTHPVGVSVVNGTTRRVSAVCTHAGGILEWNDAECTWDCPLHASRFAPDGTHIEGPAVRDLPSRDTGDIDARAE